MSGDQLGSGSLQQTLSPISRSDEWTSEEADVSASDMEQMDARARRPLRLSELSEAATLGAAGLYGYGWYFLSVVLSPWDLAPEDVGVTFAFLLVRVAPIAIVASLPIVVVLRWLRNAGSAPVSNRTAARSVDRARPAANDVVAKPAAASSASNSVTPGSEDSDSIMVELLGPKWGSVAGAVLSVVGWVLGFLFVLGLVGWLGSFPLTGLLWISGETWSAAWERAKSEDMFGWALLCAIGTAAVVTSVSFVLSVIYRRWRKRERKSRLQSLAKAVKFFLLPVAVAAFFLWWFPFQTRDLAQARVDSTKNFSLKLVGMPLLNFRTVTVSHDGRQRPGCVVFMGIHDGLAVLIDPEAESVLQLPVEAIALEAPCS